MTAITGSGAVPQARTAPRAWLPWWLPATLLAAAIAVPMLLSPYPPLQDFAEWAYQGALLARLASGQPVPGVELVGHPVPNSLTQAILGLLCLVLPPAVAARVFVLALLGAGLALCLALARRWQPGAARSLAVVLLVSVVCNATFWNGYLNYQLGLLLLAGWFLLPAPRRLQAGPIAAFGTAIFLSHAATFAAFAAVVGAEALLARRLRGAVMGLALPGLLGVWYVLAGDGGGEPTSAMGGVARFLAFKAYTVAKIGPYHNFVFAGGGDEVLRPAAYWAGSAANLTYAGLVLAALALGLWRGGVRRWPLLLAAAALLALFLLLPQNARGIVNPGERLMLPALLVLLLAVPLPAWPLRLSAGLGGLVLAANLLAFAIPARDWTVPVHFRDLEAAGGAAALFRHRPTSFACKWAALETADAPISFRTSLLRSAGEDFYCPVPP
ncbi:hypothetical protein [Paracraurococcus ruber]|nr:hypothetical protein [Paracraurococcus ruber]TDG33046.1 hypothetical protein E2C05_05200 [Paracraurococcus ruber]